MGIYYLCKFLDFERMNVESYLDLLMGFDVACSLLPVVPITIIFIVLRHT
jgi:uncharacterized membrane protein YhdT